MKYRKRTEERPENLTDFTKFQPCFTCKNCNDSCIWIAENKAVPGWVAIPNTIIQNLYWSKTYKIMYCPEWQPDERTQKKGI